MSERRMGERDAMTEGGEGVSEGCPFIAGPRCWDCDGSCWDHAPQQPEPTTEEWCAAYGHPPAGRTEIEGQPVEVCHCGETITQVGGAR